MNLKDQLKRDEGLRLHAYPDPLTNAEPWTIGYGHTGGIKEGDTITEHEASKILDSDISKFTTQVISHIPWTKQMDEVRFSVLVNMCFNMGINKLLTFVNTLKYIKAGDYEQAAINMLHSRWAEQVKGRATRLAKQMETGEWQ